MGSVWRAWDPELQREVALKRIRGEVDPQLHQRFLREARLTAGLRHPGIVAIRDFGEVAGTVFLTMDCLSGGTLAERLRPSLAARRGGAPVAPEDLRREVSWLADVAEAVAHAHEHGVLHRDLKPANVLLDGEGRACVTDFGLAREWTEAESPGATRLTREGNVLGTPAYMSPEQAGGEVEQIGPATDVWALGAMLYEVLTGRHPFEGTTPWDVIEAVRRDRPRPPRMIRPDAPPDLEEVCLRALVREPDRRIASAAAFAGDLRRWLAGESVLARAPGIAERTAAAYRRSPRALAALALGLVVLLAILALPPEIARRQRERVEGWLTRMQTAVAEFERTDAQVLLPQDNRLAAASQVFLLLDAITRQDPEFGPAHSWRGRVHLLLGDEARALADLDHGCALAPGSPWVWYLRAWTRLDVYSERRGAEVPYDVMGVLCFVPIPAETPEETALREGAQDDLDRVRDLVSAGKEFPLELVRRVRAMAAFYGRVAEGDDRIRETLDHLQGMTDPESSWIRGMALLSQRNLPGAVDALSGLLRERPYLPTARYLSGSAHLALAIEREARGEDPREFLTKADEDYQAGLARTSRHDLWIGRARVLLRRAEVGARQGAFPAKEYEAAVEHARQAIIAKPGDWRSWQTLGVAWLRWSSEEGIEPVERVRRLEAALSAFDEAIAKSGDDLLTRTGRAEAWIHRAQAEWRAGRDDSQPLAAARADLDAALRRDRDFAPARLLRARWLTRRAEQAGPSEAEAETWLRQAIEDAERAVALRPAFAVAYAQLGLAWATLGWLRTQRGQDPEEPLRRAWEAVEAGRAFDHGDEFYPFVRGYVRLLQAEAKAGDATAMERLLEPAVEAFREALARVPRDPEIRRVLARAATRLGQARLSTGADPAEAFAAAARELDALLADRPTDSDLLAARGQLRLEMSQANAQVGGDPLPLLTEALADFESALALAPGKAPTLNNAGIAARRLAEHQRGQGFDPAASVDRAAGYFQRAVECGFVLARVNRAALFVTFRRWKEAAREWEDVVRDVPEWRDRARGYAAHAHRVLAERAGPGSEALADVRERVGAGDYDALWEACDRYLLVLEKYRQNLPPADRDEWDRRESVRMQSGEVHYYRACVAALRSAGRSGPKAAAQEIVPADANTWRDQAFAEIESALGVGFDLEQALRTDTDLDPIRNDPRFGEILARSRRK